MIPRNTPLQRSTKRIPRRRAKPRRGPADVPPFDWRNKPYRDWLHDKPCACGCRRTPCDAAHTGKVNGTSSKAADSTCAPLYRLCHNAYDADRKGFEAQMGVDMQAVAAKYWGIYGEGKCT